MTIKLAFDPVLRREAFQWKKTGYSEALAFLNIRIVAIGDENDLSHKVLMWPYGSLPSPVFVTPSGSLGGETGRRACGGRVFGRAPRGFAFKGNREGVPGVALRSRFARSPVGYSLQLRVRHTVRIRCPENAVSSRVPTPGRPARAVFPGRGLWPFQIGEPHNSGQPPGSRTAGSSVGDNRQASCYGRP